MRHCLRPRYDPGAVAVVLVANVVATAVAHSCVLTASANKPFFCVLCSPCLQMRRGAMFLNKTSKANGSLMRAAPLAIWGHRLADDELAACARAHSSLTHPNPTNADAEAAWLIALAEVISGGSNEAALSRSVSLNAGLVWLSGLF